jgi:hypothetical protein
MVAKVTSLTPIHGPSRSISSFLVKAIHRLRRRVIIGIALASHRADRADIA